MPDFNEQLDTIARLRAVARRYEESWYGARTALRTVQRRVERANRGQTVTSPDRDSEVARLREQMAHINARLADLREQARKTGEQLAQIYAQAQLVAQLTQNLNVIRSRIEALHRALDGLHEENPRPQDEIAALTAQLEALERSKSNLEEAIRVATEKLRGMRGQEQQLKQQLEATNGRMDGVRSDLQGLQSLIGELLQPVHDNREDIDQKIDALTVMANDNRRAATEAAGHLAGAIHDLYGQDPHPRRTLALLNDGTPFLLFPVRIETIFATATSQDGVPIAELRVRVYPDEILVHTHEPTLTDREVDAGQLYWTELLVATHLRTKREDRQRDAWSHIVNLFGGQRAAWVAKNTKPSDWDPLFAAGDATSLIQFLKGADANFFTTLLGLSMTASARSKLRQAIAADDGDQFFEIASSQNWGERINTTTRTQIAGFPVVDLTRTDAWSRAPRTRILPDRFVLLLYATETSSPQEVVGRIIDDTVFVGPDPLEPKSTLVTKDGALTLGGDCDWLTNFDAAITKGLGFRVPLTEEQANTGFAHIAVLGLRLSANAEQSAGMLEELITDHQYSPKGFSLVSQGTPTNNTERDGSGYSDNDTYNDLAFFTEIEPPAFDPNSADPLKSQTDGRLLADALGIGYSTLQTVQNADQTDVLEARAMNTALFPATLGYWLKNWMAPVVSADAARLTRSFFTKHVTGRGPLPAIRVGNQPYGVLVTSDMSRWKYSAPPGHQPPLLPIDELTPFLAKLYGILQQLEKHWQTLAADLLYVGRSGTDSAAVLMNVLGLQPTSVEFLQRIGFHKTYLAGMQRFTSNNREAAELIGLLTVMRPMVKKYLTGLGVNTDVKSVGEMLALNVLWQHYVGSLPATSLVDPKPLSEVNTLTLNYVDWLATAENTTKITEQQFPAQPPSALLYLMLRNALLLQLNHGTYAWLKERCTFEPALNEALNPYIVIPGMRPTPTISKFELMSVPVTTVEPSHPAPGASVADWIWFGPVAKEEEGAYVKDQKTALAQLAKAPTARLQRGFIEHLDCCQYRLDAWETGLFSQRLAMQRGGVYQDRKAGVYIGAYGWVERVKRTPRVGLRREDLPAKLRPSEEDKGPIFEEDALPSTSRRAQGLKRGGYTHAPSISHAAAAALLRNAYLSHSDSEQSDVLSNNLSSDRVRRAQFLLEGMRNGQPIEALLGYQFERALHDRTSASAAGGGPLIELNEFILPYRQAFPFDSREIPQAGTGPARETVPPFSVVNGLKLTTADLNAANGYGLSSVLNGAPAPGADQSAAILTARDSLVETVDAVKDLLMAENAYQLVQGNFDRVAAVSLAQKEARIPPSLEVLNTPRGTQFAFSNRVTLHFDNLDPLVPAANPWPAIDMTARAAAEPGVNFWLGRVLGGDPSEVGCKAWHVAAGSNTPLDAAFVTLADLNIQPIDLVMLTSINVTDSQGGATELEARIAARYRAANGVLPEAIIKIDFNPDDAPGALTFGQIFPLVRRLRALLSECRALDARDFLPAAGGKASTVPVNKDNPGGYDVSELRTRVQALAASLTTLADRLDGPTAPSVSFVLLHDPADAGDDEPFAGSLGAAFAKLDEAQVNYDDTSSITVTFSIVDAGALQATLSELALFGVADSFSPETDLSDDRARLALLSRARRVARRLRRAEPKDGVLDRAQPLIDAAKPERPALDQVTSLLQAGQVLFCDTLKLLPQFTYYNDVDLAASAGARAQLLSYALMRAPGLDAGGVVDEWLQGLARVRPRLHTWEVVRSLADALTDTSLDMAPVQVPFRNEDRWLAVEFPVKDPLDATKTFGISSDTLSITAHGATAFNAGVAQRGILLDEWSEDIPTASETTGISFRFNQPNAVPAQALLLAVTPEETGSWGWDALVGTLNDTLARAKRRAVEPAQLEATGNVEWNALAPALVAEFSALEQADVSLDYLVAVKYEALDNFYTEIEKA
jgi:predicted  nucleic acid-binding Zn-ribbon protein